MKFDDRIKNSIEEITPDPYMKTRLSAKISEGTRPKKSHLWRKVGATALALAIVLAGTAGANHLIINNYIEETTNSHFTESTNTQGGILIAYAQTAEPVRLDELKIDQMPIFYNLTIVDLTASDSEIKEKYDSYDKIKANIENKVEEIAKEGKGIGTRYSTSTGEKSVLLFCASGEFLLDLDDYSQIEKLTVSNSSKYGYIDLAIALDKEELKDSDDEYTAFKESDDFPKVIFRHSNSVSATGSELQSSRESGIFEMGLDENEINTGYEIIWHHSYELNEAIEENPKFDLTQIKDKVVFEVSYKNGDTSKATVNISFDTDGNMILENGGYNYYSSN